MINTDISHVYYIPGFHFIKYFYVGNKSFWNVTNIKNNSVVSHKLFFGNKKCALSR